MSDTLLGMERAGFGLVALTGGASLVAIMAVTIYWFAYFDRLQDVFKKLKLCVVEPGWVRRTRVGIILSVPLVMMTGAYIGAFYTHSVGGALLGVMLAGLAYAWCVKATITCGYYPKSQFAPPDYGEQLTAGPTALQIDHNRPGHDGPVNLM